MERSSALEFGFLPPTPQSPTAVQSQAASAPTTYTRDQATAHANVLAQQVKAAAQAELESLQEQAKLQVVASISELSQNEEENLQIRQASQQREAASQQREAELLSELQHNCINVDGQVACYARQQQEDSAHFSHQERLLHEKDAQAYDLQARLDQL